MTQNKEDYLKAIYGLGGDKEIISNKQIAAALHIAPASVTEMLRKLSQENLIEYKAYKGLTLTEEGTKSALMLIRGHRLWEVFLIDHLGYSWSEAHEDAELLEHITPPRLRDRLDGFLNYPPCCPHGYAIPDGDGQMICRSLETLNKINIGELCFVRMVGEEAELMDYLQNLGLKIGSQVRLMDKAAYEGPLTIDINGEQKQVSYKAACQIYVDQTMP